MEQKEILDVMKKLAIESGAIIMDIYETNFEVSYKEDASPLTVADKLANTHIVHGLEKICPDYAILSEEIKDDLSRRKNPWCFIIDPLDGTKEFVNRNGQFTVNIALVHNSHPVLGVIYVPVTKKLYYASVEEGAFLEDLMDKSVHPLTVSNKKDNLIWVGSKSHSSEKEKALIDAHKDIISEIISAGSSLKGCMVAEAKADVYYRFGPTCEWDTAAMQCIAEQSGAIVRQMDGTELVYNRENTLNDKGFFIVNAKENIWV